MVYNQNMKYVHLLVGGIILCIVGVILFATRQEPSVQPAELNQSTPFSGTIRIVATGDMIPHDTVTNQASSEGGFNYVPFFEDVLPVFSSSSIGICNQESPSAGQTLGISGHPSFNAPIAFAQGLSEIGCNVVNLANDHTDDRGQEGLDATIAAWQDLDRRAVIGANDSSQAQNEVTILEQDGISIAVLGFTDNDLNESLSNHAVNSLNDEDLVSRLVNEASDAADYVVVYVHWGVEYTADVTDTQRQQAELLAIAGADVVIGSGPHILQTTEVISTESNDTFVYYSLGNFLSSQLELNQRIGGFAIIDLDISEGSLVAPRYSFAPTFMHYEWSEEDEAAFNLLARTNLRVTPLDQAEVYFESARIDSTIEAELTKVTQLLTRLTDVNILSASDF